MKEDKIEQMLHAMEHPEDYTDQQLEQLFSDEEVRCCYEIAVKAEQQLSNNGLPKNERVHSTYWHKIAAVFVGGLLLSGIAIAAIQLSKNNSEKNNEPVMVTAEPTQPAIADAGTLPMDTTITFENAELEVIMSQLANHYKVTVDFNKEDARHLRLYTKWTPAETLDQVVERLNGFEKVTIKKNNNTLVIE